MIDQPSDNAPLFQDADAQETAYAPQQVPGSQGQQAIDASDATKGACGGD